MTPVRPDARSAEPTTSAAGHALSVLVLLVAVGLAFWPALDNGFVDWDDDDNLTDNPAFRGLAWTHIRWMLTTNLLQVYQPLSWLVFGAQYVLFGLSAPAFHAVSLCLHAANAIVFYFLAGRVLRRAREKPVPSLAPLGAAMFFSLHPLRVEAVAWASCQPYLLASLFGLLTVQLYLKAQGPPATGRWYLLALLTYALALLSKSIVVPLPLWLVLLEIYPLRRLSGRPTTWWRRPAERRVGAGTLPFFGLSLLGMAAGILANLDETVGSTRGITTALAASAFGTMFYLWRTLVPVGLSPLYELPAEPAGHAVVFVACGIGFLLLTLAALVFRRRWPFLIAAWAGYLIQIGPVLGFVRHTDQIAADRYAYLAGLPFALLIGGLIAAAFGAAAPGRRLARALAPVVIVGLIAFVPLARRQTSVWRDSITLWEHALGQSATARFGRSKIVHSNLGVAYGRAGRWPEAVDQLSQALAVAPSDPDVHTNIGNVYRMMGRLRLAAKHFRAAVETAPAPDVLHALGETLGRLGDLGAARNAYEAALALAPDHAECLNDLAWLLATAPSPALRDGPRATTLARRVVELAGDRSVGAWRSLAAIESMAARFPEAVAAAERALALAQAQGGDAAGIVAELDRYRAGLPFKPMTQPASDGRE